jgi:hypothetical protein
MIDQVTISDASRAIAFADDIRAVYDQVSEMQTKIDRYIAGIQAIAIGSVDARERKFVELVQAIVSEEDLSRVGALKPFIDSFVLELETNYDDFINPQ